VPRDEFDSPEPGPELVEAYSGSRVDAELIRSVLEGSGIECALWGTGSTYLPETGAKLSAVRVMVRPSDRERAHEVIDAAGVGDLDLATEWDTEGGNAALVEVGEWQATASAPEEDYAGSEGYDGSDGPGHYEDEDDWTGAGPWYSRPWGQVVVGAIALLLVIAMIATYALE
jgi:hypothetical protein